METKPGKAQNFYRWVDGQGHLHVVSSLESVPPAERAKASLVELNSDDSLGQYQAAGSASGSSWRPDWTSFAAGFGVALLLALVFRMLPNSFRWLWRVGLVLAVGALLTAAYLGAVRRSTGVPGASALATPSALIEDAKSAVEQMNQRQKQQEEEIRKIQAEGH